MRAEAWRRAIVWAAPGADPAWAGELAGRFRLTPGQIRDTAADAAREQTMGGAATLGLGDELPIVGHVAHEHDYLLGLLALQIAEDGEADGDELLLAADASPPHQIAA